MDNKNNIIRKIQDKKVVVNYINQKIKIDEEDQKIIDSYWKEVEDKYTRGDIFVVDSITGIDDKIVINIMNSDYAHYIYVRRHPGKVRDCFNLWSGILLETLDQKYVIGKMSGITESTGEYHISGGSCDKGELEGSLLNYETTMFRELKEEIGISRELLKDVKLKYLKNAFFKEQDIGILYKAIIKMTSIELERYYQDFLKKLKNENGEIEFERLAFIDKNINAINEFCKINKTPEYTRELLLQDVDEK